MKLARPLAALVAAALAVAVAPSLARADTPISCTVLEIAASTTKEGGLAPELKPLEKKLRKPPLSSWNTFKLLGRQSADLEPMKAATLKLAQGQAQVMVRDVDKAEGKKPRVGLSLQMDDPSGKRVLDTKLSVDAGDYVVIGRTLANNDGHLLAMSCKL